MPDARVFFDGSFTEPRLDHPEGIAVAADGAIWCGGESGQIYRIAPDGSAIEQVASTGGFCLGLAFGPDGQLYVCDQAHAAVLRLNTTTGELERFADGADGRRMRIPNHLAFDSAGRLYVSDSHGFKQPGPGIFRFDPDGSGLLWYNEPLNFANGLAFSADGHSLYVVETWAHRISRITIDDDRPADASVVAHWPGVLPDGLAVGADGALYVACYQPSQVLRIGRDGTCTTVADDPEAHLLCHPTNVAFRDHELFATNLGRWHVTAIPVDSAGIALPITRPEGTP